MKRIVVLLIALLFGLMHTSSVSAANLLVNGSFENGLNGWSSQSLTPVSIAPGLCGAKAANVQDAFMRQTGFLLRGGQTYKLIFQMKGKLMTNASQEILETADWTRVVRQFTADRTGDTVWFYGFTSRDGLVDCVKLKRVKS